MLRMGGSWRNGIKPSRGAYPTYFDVAFSGCRDVLDIGCGSGRDLVRLLQRGHAATGCDNCQAMLEAAAQACRAAGFAETRLVSDGLPELASFEDTSFDGLLCSAVLMHLPDEYLFDSIYGMRRVLRSGGRLLLSIPAYRPDVDPQTRRDPQGRYFADLPPAKLKLLLERVGFRHVWEQTSNDAQGRAGTTWATLLFEKQQSDAERPLDQVESILNRDKKDATYKLALFRALADVAQTQYNIASFDRAGRVGIPVRALAERWLVYYWPLVASDTFIAQKYGETADCTKPIAIREPLRKVIDAFGEGGGLPAFLVALKNNTVSADVARLHRMAIQKIQSTIWNMPVRYAGGGSDFSVFGYDRATCQVTMPEELWRELTLTGSWILDATVLRWAELTERLSKGTVNVSLAVEKLLSISDPARETRDARILFKNLNVSKCVWSEKKISGDLFDVDHVIPFTLWRNNDLWNLLPTHPSINNSKRDFLPSQPLLHRQRHAVIGYWEALREAFSDRFDREASGLCGGSGLPKHNWKDTLFGRLVEAVEITAVQRCVPRWDPKIKTTPRVRVVVTTQTPSQPEIQVHGQSTEQHTQPLDEPVLHDFEYIQDEAFVRYLPMVGALAAGAPFSGFDISDIDAATGCQWIEVPERWAGKNRFVIQIAGDSMEPELSIGDHVIFEYHRNPRTNNQIVIANLADYGIASDLSTDHAVKRLIETPDQWIFRSTNPSYEDISVSKAECPYPILGTMIKKL
jgi:SAM-dependent methyltransferase/phage repressor protein C with HTH and peptisase S24 domain